MGLQCFIIGPFQLISPASFHNQKDLGHKLSVWPVDYDQELLWSLSSSVKEEKTNTNKSSSWFMACFQSPWRQRYTNTAESVMTESSTSKTCSVVLELFPAFKTSYILNKDTFPLPDKASRWKGTALKGKTIIYQTYNNTRFYPQKSWTWFQI